MQQRPHPNGQQQLFLRRNTDATAGSCKVCWQAAAEAAVSPCKALHQAESILDELWLLHLQMPLPQQRVTDKKVAASNIKATCLQLLLDACLYKRTTHYVSERDR